LRRKLEDTARVSGLLHSIFGEDESDFKDENDEVNRTNTPAIGGLDIDHSAFLLALGDKDSWDRNALESLAEHHGLLLEGALDTINEKAFDVCDAPCIEESDDDDKFIIERSVFEEMTT